MKSEHYINKESFFIKELSLVPASYWRDAVREEYFEIVFVVTGGERFVSLIPLYRTTVVAADNKKGCLLAFKRTYLEQDDKEYDLDTVRLFEGSDDRLDMPLDRELSDRLMRILMLMIDECAHPEGTYLIVKALLKVLLANLIRGLVGAFSDQDLNQKRVHQFVNLVNEHYKQERKAAFYAREMGISEKRLNQVLLGKLHQTVTQQIHARLILEAKRMLISADLTTKEIAYQLNFEDPAYFTRFFKRHTGITPEKFGKGSDSL